MIKENEITDAMTGRPVEDHPAMQWLFQYGKLLLWIALGLIILLFIATRFFSINASGSDYANGEYYLSQFEKNGDEGALINLESILKKDPALHPKYDGVLAEQLLIQGKVKKAKEFANLEFSRTKGDVNAFYTAFGDHSFLIGEGKYQEALDKAKTLQVELLRNQSLAELRIFNMLRIASLQHVLNLRENERETLQEIKQLLETNTPEINRVSAIFNEGSLTLKRYVEYRLSIKNILTPSEKEHK